MPTSRVDIHSTDRYTFVTKHPELAVFATRPLAVGVVLSELQGSVVPLPEEWRAEMDLGDEFAREAAGRESEESDVESEQVEVDEQAVRRKGKEVERGQRRSDRTRRRDFSIVWSGLKRCYQLFLGPARFLNVSPGFAKLMSARLFAYCRASQTGELYHFQSNPSNPNRR
jgi:histone-lysine N-methyltransferase SUV420H